MLRLLCLLLAVLLAVGCKSAPKPNLDPVLGRATVPPPKPGDVLSQQPSQYYAATPPPPASATNRLALPASGQWSTTPPPVVNSTAVAPIRQQSYQQPVVAQPVAVAQPAPITIAQPVVQQQPIQILQPTAPQYIQQPNCRPCPQPARVVCPEEVPPGTRSALTSEPRSALVTPASDSVAAFRRAGLPGEPTPANSVEPGRLTVDSQARNIMDIPPATRPGSPTPAGGAVQPASFTSAGPNSGMRSALSNTPTAAATSTSTPTSPSATIRSRYGYDANYNWLKGQLEYSKAARRWKLRYIPLDGETDPHGGSVVLADSPLLASFEPGDYVLVDGRIDGRNDPSEKTFSPLYQVARIDKARP
ncbi:MAG: hypothetical protein AB7O62_03450 [Pirellulales bacterium]